jgi:hypothetical protein
MNDFQIVNLKATKKRLSAPRPEKHQDAPRLSTVELKKKEKRARDRKEATKQLSLFRDVKHRHDDDVTMNIGSTRVALPVRSRGHVGAKSWLSGMGAGPIGLAGHWP